MKEEEGVMTPDKIFSIIVAYEAMLKGMKVPKTRMDPRRTFWSLSENEILAHAHYLCTDAQKYARDEEKYGKANRHLTAIQMCLSFAGIYTLAELMNQNSE